MGQQHTPHRTGEGQSPSLGGPTAWPPRVVDEAQWESGEEGLCFMVCMVSALLSSPVSLQTSTWEPPETCPVGRCTADPRPHGPGVMGPKVADRGGNRSRPECPQQTLSDSRHMC